MGWRRVAYRGVLPVKRAQKKGGAEAPPLVSGGCDGEGRRTPNMRRPHKESKSLFELLLAQDRRQRRYPHHRHAADLFGDQ